MMIVTTPAISDDDDDELLELEEAANGEFTNTGGGPGTATNAVVKEPTTTAIELMMGPKKGLVGVSAASAFCIASMLAGVGVLPRSTTTAKLTPREPAVAPRRRPTAGTTIEPVAISVTIETQTFACSTVTPVAARSAAKLLSIWFVTTLLAHMGALTMGP